MANVVFDKHVEFCEKYMEELHSTIVTLFSKGPSKEAIDHAKKLFQLRAKYASWITPKISDNLHPFEDELLKMGNHAHYASLFGAGVRTPEAITSMYDIFNRLLKIETTKEMVAIKVKTNAIKEEIAIGKIKSKIRAILGIEELTTMREKLIEEAIKSLNQ